MMFDNSNNLDTGGDASSRLATSTCPSGETAARHSLATTATTSSTDAIPLSTLTPTPASVNEDSQGHSLRDETSKSTTESTANSTSPNATDDNNCTIVPSASANSDNIDPPSPSMSPLRMPLPVPPPPNVDQKPPPALPLKKSSMQHQPPPPLPPPPQPASSLAPHEFELAHIGSQARTLPGFGQHPFSRGAGNSTGCDSQQSQRAHHRSCALVNSIHNPLNSVPPVDTKRHFWHLSCISLAFLGAILLSSCLVACAVGWSTMANAKRELDASKTLGEILTLQTELGELTLSIGWEMLSKVNETISSLSRLLARSSISASPGIRRRRSSDPTAPLNSSLSPNDSQAIKGLNSNFTLTAHLTDESTQRQHRTNLAFEKVTSSMAKTAGLVNQSLWLRSAVDVLRNTCSFEDLEALKNSQVVNVTSQLIFAPLKKCIESYGHMFTRLDTLVLHNNSHLSEATTRTELNELLIRSMPVTLFIRGLVARFNSLTMGLVALAANFSHDILNATDYLGPFYTSRQLLDASFVWNPRHQEQHNEVSFDHRVNLLTNYLSSKDRLEQDNYLRMASIFGQLFNTASLERIRSYIKKKNVETVERVVSMNGNRTKYVTDEEANNRVSLQLNIDEIESIGLEQIKRVLVLNQGNYLPYANLSQHYNQLMKNQIAFVVRLQDYMSMSMAKHSGQQTAVAQHAYNLAAFGACSQMALSVVTLVFAIYNFFASRWRGEPSNRAAITPPSSSLSQRMRRRLWSATSVWTLFKSCFKSGSTNAGASSLATGSNTTGSGISMVGNGGGSGGYPLLYKANDGFASPNARGSRWQASSSSTSTESCTCNQISGQQQQQQASGGGARRGYRYTALSTSPPLPQRPPMMMQTMPSTSGIGNGSPHTTKTAMLVHRFEATRASSSGLRNGRHDASPSSKKSGKQADKGGQSGGDQ